MSTARYISAQNRISCSIVQEPVFWIARPAANKFPLENPLWRKPDRSIKIHRLVLMEFFNQEILFLVCILPPCRGVIDSTVYYTVPIGLDIINICKHLTLLAIGLIARGA